MGYVVYYRFFFFGMSMRLKLNNLHLLTGTALTSAIATISPEVTELDLSDNSVGQTKTDFAEALAAIPSTVTSLILARTNLREMNAYEVARTLIVIPKSIMHLSLSGNQLQLKSDLEVRNQFRYVPAGPTAVYLSFESTYTRSNSQLAIIFKWIPKTILSLDVSDNDFVFCKSIASLIPMNVNKIILSSSSIEKLSTQEIINSVKVLSYITDVQFIGEESTKTALFREGTGSGYATIFQKLLHIENLNNSLPNALALEILSYLTLTDSNERLKSVITKTTIETPSAFRYIFLTTMFWRGLAKWRLLPASPTESKSEFDSQYRIKHA